MKATNYIRNNFFGKHLQFEYRIYMIFFFESIFISILSATTNTLLGKGLAGITFQWTFIILCIIVIFIPLRMRQWLMKPLLVVICLIYIPFLFFQTAGYDGTALFFVPLGLFELGIVFRGKTRWILISLNILICIGICLAQYSHPELIVPHANDQAELMDLLVASILSFTGISILIAFVSNAYEIERVRIQKMAKELEDMSNQDELTGVYNRRFMNSYLKRELDIVTRTDSNICIMMIDIDFFKKVNDTYGHNFGDEVLIALSQTIQKNLRTYDILVRMGGEEFVVILDSIDLKGANEIAKRTKDAVAQMRLKNDVRITVSIGLVQARKNDSIESLIERADINMYKAKDGGRNMIVSEAIPE